jgi:hypothetical protein
VSGRRDRTETELTFFFEPEAAARCGVLKETDKVPTISYIHV